MSRIEGPRGTIGKACRVTCVVKKVLSMQYADYSHSRHGLIVPGSILKQALMPVDKFCQFNHTNILR